MKMYGLIGYPLGHSFSKKFFTAKFDQENSKEQYLNFELPAIEDLPSIILKYPELSGLNVTIPYKTQVIPYLDELDTTAASIGAVNTILISRSSSGKAQLKGYNTDVFGFEQSLRPLLKQPFPRALVLGTGGASKAVHFVLSSLGIEALSVSRSITGSGNITYAQLTRDLLLTYTLIINTTPLGTFPGVGMCPDIPYEHLSESHILYDLIYNPPATLFLEKGMEKGAVVKNGYEMLELQALRSYSIWNGLIY
jgi:shikimate dehydrogenase